MSYKDVAWFDAEAAPFMGGYSKHNVQFSGPVFADKPADSDRWFSNLEIAAIGPNVAGPSTRKLTPGVQQIMDAVAGATDSTPVVYVAFGTCDAPSDDVFRLIIEDLCAEDSKYLAVIKISGHQNPADFAKYSTFAPSCVCVCVCVCVCGCLPLATFPFLGLFFWFCPPLSLFTT